MPSRFSSGTAHTLLKQMLRIRSSVIEFEELHAHEIDRIVVHQKASARNLLHYMGLRQHDLRELQMQLASLGLSSLGRLEANTLAAIDAVILALHKLSDLPFPELEPLPPVDFESGPKALEEHALTLLGASPESHHSRIMVTMPPHAATDYEMVRDLLQRGMDIARINTAHDNPRAWRAMVQNIHTAENETRRHCRIHADLSGPKLRTGAVEGGQIIVDVGDKVIITDGSQIGHFRSLDGLPRIPCTLPRVIRDVREGHHIWFDDGKIGGLIQDIGEHQFTVEITHGRIGGVKLRADKGINLPDTELTIPALTPKDLRDLHFIKDHCHSVGLSFVRRPEDVLLLEDKLAAIGAPDDLGIILKIENNRSFENLPRLLLAGMYSPPIGVMVARGDLAVEIGFERLAEVQEEILWICEAAHVPVIWATQVLESLAKKGIPSRAEVTDAAMGVRAECVMLNKGPHIMDAVDFLHDVLHRMEEHMSKKRAMLRKLSVSDLV